jgi:hypothetical protein
MKRYILIGCAAITGVGAAALVIAHWIFHFVLMAFGLPCP